MIKLCNFHITNKDAITIMLKLRQLVLNLGFDICRAVRLEAAVSKICSQACSKNESIWLDISIENKSRMEGILFRFSNILKPVDFSFGETLFDAFKITRLESGAVIVEAFSKLPRPEILKDQDLISRLKAGLSLPSPERLLNNELTSKFGLHPDNKKPENLQASSSYSKNAAAMSQKVSGSSKNAAEKSCFRDNKNSVNLNKIRGARILLVEDNYINQQVAREILESEGFRVDIADNGQRAIDLVLNNSYDIIFMDLQMPVLDGYQATMQIRAKNLTKLPIIALSADTTENIQERVIMAGMNGFMSKPINPELLFKVLVKWIKPGKREYISKKFTQSVNYHHELLTQLTSFDVNSAIQRVSGNHNLYIEILQKFKRNYLDFEENLHLLASADDRKKLAMQLHKLKGVAGNIGANDIHHLTHLLELKLKSGEDILLLDETKLLLDKLRTAINEISSLKIDPGESVSPLLSNEELLEKINQLQTLLDEYDAFAGNIMPQIRSTLIQMGYKDLTEQLDFFISNYHIEEAQDICQAILDDLQKGRVSL